MITSDHALKLEFVPEWIAIVESGYIGLSMYFHPLICSSFLNCFVSYSFQVRGIETVSTYDSNTGEFVINTPCESAQKYWIGGAANV